MAKELRKTPRADISLRVEVVKNLFNPPMLAEGLGNLFEELRKKNPAILETDKNFLQAITAYESR